MAVHTIPYITILGTNVSLLDVDELHTTMANIISTGRKELVLHVNINAINLAYREKWYREILNMAPTVFCDGYGVKLGACILGHSIPERITYADWMWQLSEYAESRDWRFYLLGGKPGVAEKATEKLREKHPNLKIVGAEHGYFDKSQGSIENEAVIQRINAARPNILLVAFGMPLQEHWLMENWDRIEVNIALTGGAALDYVSDTLKRGPRWLTDSGLEWLARLFIEPKRLWKRYLIGNPVFIWRVILERLGLLSFEEETTKR